MKRVLTVAFIVTYLGLLGYGNLCHMLGHGITAHPLMYFIVWDMFCGWAAHDTRLHIIGEGEDQKYYELSPGPWGEFKPWGTVGRQHYDMVNTHSGRIAFNTLAHTTHVPLTRILAIEEAWPKKFNLPDPVWNMRYDEPKDMVKYHRVRSVMLPDGEVARVYNSWLANQAEMALADNPRLRQQATQSRSLFVIDAIKPGREMMLGTGSGTGAWQPVESPVGAPLGN